MAERVRTGSCGTNGISGHPASGCFGALGNGLAAGHGTLCKSLVLCAVLGLSLVDGTCHRVENVAAALAARFRQSTLGLDGLRHGLVIGRGTAHPECTAG
jgi:hypothetical protein